MNQTCHEHNRSRPVPTGPRPWGVRLSLPPGDPMAPILGEDWHQYQWFVSEAERDARIEQLRQQFVYYRKGDQPRFVIERVNREADGAG